MGGQKSLAAPIISFLSMHTEKMNKRERRNKKDEAERYYNFE